VANQVFEALLMERIDIFRSSFSSVSHTLFYDETEKQLIHSGEYGAYREAVCREFLRFLILGRLEISQGFLINTEDEISTQCDIVVYDADSTPLIQNEERQRFFPTETVCAIGEVKSKVQSRSDLRKALNKLSTIKRMRESTTSPTIRTREGTNAFYDPIATHDQMFSFLICQRFEFSHEDIAAEIGDLYDNEVPYRSRHNLILSLEDGLLLYYDHETDNAMFPYPVVQGREFKNMLYKPGGTSASLVHFKTFAHFVFLGTSNATLFYPDIVNYMGSISGGTARRQD
jgi:hypothetical protein